jgi:hypothetical protein
VLGLELPLSRASDAAEAGFFPKPRNTAPQGDDT